MYLHSNKDDDDLTNDTNDRGLAGFIVPQSQIHDIDAIIPQIVQKAKSNNAGLAELLLIVWVAEKNKEIVEMILSKMDNFKQLNATHDIYEFVYTEQRISKRAFEYGIDTGRSMIVDYVCRACWDLVITLAISEFKLAELIVNSYKNENKEVLLQLSEQDLLLEISQDQDSIKQLSSKIKNSFKMNTRKGNLVFLIIFRHGWHL